MKRDSRMILLAVVAVAVLLGATLVGTAAIRGRTSPTSPDAPLQAVAPIAGTAQQGIVLGSPAAPVTLVEFADVQCPYCGEFARNALPTILRDYVRNGRVRIVYQGLAFVGPDSRTALRAVLAAGLQNHAWDLLDGLYRRQGVENTGWVTEHVLREVAAGVPGLDVARMFRQARGKAVAQAMRTAERLARQAGVRGTPTFFVGKSGGPLHRVQLTSLSADALRSALDAALQY